MIDTETHAPAVGTYAADDAVVTDWVQHLHDALLTGDRDAIAGLFQPDGTVRELLALSNDFRNAIGRERVADLLTDSDTTAPERFVVQSDSVHRAGDDGSAIAAFVEFRTAEGAGDGYVLLAETDDPGTWAAASLVLRLESLEGLQPAVGSHRPHGRSHLPTPGRADWIESLRAEADRNDPPVVIVGAGHNGLMLAARLKVLGIPSLLVERNARVGDNWRKRYRGLALHTPIEADHLPYIPFPETWTRFTPKDKLGDFFESYARLLDLAVVTGTSVRSASRNADGWTVDVEDSTGTRRVLTARHLVFATGINGSPRIPQLPGASTFQGTVLHAVQYDGWERWQGKRAVVVGSGVSGHDVAQDLAEHGVDVTMVQRSGTIVMSGDTFHQLMYPNHLSGRFTTDQADLIGAATPFPVLPTQGAAQLAKAKEMDSALLDELRRVGFELSDGPDGEGVLGSIFRQGGTGYYYNAGASELIADGTIALDHGDVTALAADGVVLADGRSIPADLVVFATGYRGATTAPAEVLGAEVAAELGQFARVGDDGEFGRLWRRTGIDGLWFMISLGIDNARFYSKLLALQIAGSEVRR